jgi:hypothetical protein
MREDEVMELLRPKVADYITSIASLMFAATFDASGWISLDCDLNRLQIAEQFRVEGTTIAVPILKLY